MDSRVGSFGSGQADSLPPTTLSGNIPTRQTMAGKPNGYQDKSALDDLRPSGNGIGGSDRNRLLLNGQMLPSENGRSNGYAQQMALLDSPYRPI